MTVQGYQGSDAEVVTEEEVNRRRAATERKRGLARPRPRTPRAPVTPPGNVQEDPRRALCSNAELLDALDSADADATLERHQLSTDGPEVLIGDAPAGVAEVDADDILEQLEHHHDVRPARAHSLRVRGTADLAPSTPATRPRRHRSADSRSRRLSIPRRGTSRAMISLLVIVGLCAAGALSVTGAHQTAPRMSRVSAPLTGAGLTMEAAVTAENGVADRARDTGTALGRAGAWARAAAAARTRHLRALARARRLKRARAAQAKRIRAVAASSQAADVTHITTPVATTAQTTTTAVPVQNAAPVQTSRPASSASPAFGSDGALGPGHSPDS
jgi:hypothetical protein